MQKGAAHTSAPFSFLLLPLISHAAYTTQHVALAGTSFFVQHGVASVAVAAAGWLATPDVVETQQVVLAAVCSGK